LAEARSKARLVFGSSFFWLPTRWDNLLSYDLYHSHDTCNIVVVYVFSGVKASLSMITLWGAKKFLPVFRWPTAIGIDTVYLFQCAVIVFGAWSTFVISSGL
jgi:hypothetical protein